MSRIVSHLVTYPRICYQEMRFRFTAQSHTQTPISSLEGGLGMRLTAQCTMASSLKGAPPLSFPSRMPYWSPDQTRMLTTCMAAWIDNKCQSYVFDCINWGAICECLLQAGFIPAAYLECQIYTASISLILNPLPTVTRGCNVTKKNIIMSGMVQRTCCIFCTISPIVKV